MKKPRRMAGLLGFRRAYQPLTEERGATGLASFEMGQLNNGTFSYEGFISASSLADNLTIIDMNTANGAVTAFGTIVAGTCTQPTRLPAL